jgi:hypothetical protein
MVIKSNYGQMYFAALLAMQMAFSIGLADDQIANLGA